MGKVFFVMAFVAACLFAAEPDAKTYAEMVKRARVGDPKVDFRAMRFACLKAESCDARGDRDRMAAMRRAVEAKDHQRVVEAAEALIAEGFTNIEAHMTIAPSYQALGDPDKAALHRGIALGLIRSMMDGRDGKSKETAFEVVGSWEEYLVVQLLGYPPFGGQTLMAGPPHSYDVQKARDPKTGREVEIYFNIDAFYPRR